MDDKRRMMLDEIPRLRRFARGLCGDPALADDLVQDCLERALSRLHQWRDGTNMRAWLLTILRNLFFNQRRNASRAPQQAELETAPETAIAAPPEQDSGLAARDMARQLAALPDQQREVLLLIGLEELSYKEAADVLGVPVGTVMSRLARGRDGLRERMTGVTRDAGSGHPDLRRIK